MDEVLKKLADQEKGISFVGTTVVQTEQLLRELEMLDMQAQVSTLTVTVQRRVMTDMTTKNICITLQTRCFLVDEHGMIQQFRHIEC